MYYIFDKAFRKLRFEKFVTFNPQKNKSTTREELKEAGAARRI